MVSFEPSPHSSKTVEVRDMPLPDAEGLNAVIEDGHPALFRGAARHWPLVSDTPQAICAALQASHSGEPVVLYRAPPQAQGRFFYNDALDGFNFTAAREPLADAIAAILASAGSADSEALYIGSCDVHRFFPGLIPAIEAALPLRGMTGLWIGNRTTATCHYDYSHNIAACLSGRRRFTLFPPSAIAGLYPGPLEPTPGGQVVSMVDFKAPDLERFPLFANALEQAQVAEMEPGDVLVYPAMWWHHVEALDDFNLLLNLWWNDVPDWVDSPQTTLLHALLSLGPRSPAERDAWRALFDYYVFDHEQQARAHLPAHAQEPLAPLDAGTARRLRARILSKLQR